MSGVDPLNPSRQLPWYQEVVVGPPETGNRKTVVDIRAGAINKPWIDRVDVPAGTGMTVTYFVDNGAVGGTYEGPYRLPDLETTGTPDNPSGVPKRTETILGLPWWVAVLLGLGAVAAIRSRGSQDWR